VKRVTTPLLTIQVGWADDSQSDLYFTTAVGDPDVQVRKVEDWMLEAAEVALHAAKLLKKKIERGFIAQTIANRQMRRRERKVVVPPTSPKGGGETCH